MKYGVFYIATSIYKEYINKFINTVQYIFPNDEIELIILSDGLDEYDHNILYNRFNVHVEKIIDYPYPLINLCKFQTIYYYAKKYNIDYILYFDADTIIFEKNQYFWNNIKFILNTNKLICSYHPHYLYHNESIFYNDGFIYNDSSLGVYCEPHYIHNNKCYIMSSFFMGHIDAIEYTYKQIYEMSSKDLRNYRWVPWFSDEAYLNALYVNDNIISNKNTILLNKYITINPYHFNNVNFENGDIYHNNFKEYDSIFINQKYDIEIKDKKREDILI